MTNNDGRWQTTRCIQHKSWHRPSHDHLRLKLMHGSSPVTSNTTDQHNTKTTTTLMLSRPWPWWTIVTWSQPQCEDDHNRQPTMMHVSPDITRVMTNHIWISSFFQYQLNEFYLRQQILGGSVPWWHQFFGLTSPVWYWPHSVPRLINISYNFYIICPV